MLNFIVDYKDAQGNNYHRACQAIGVPIERKHQAADQVRKTIAASGFRVQAIHRVLAVCTLEELERAADGPLDGVETLYVSPEFMREAQRRA